MAKARKKSKPSMEESYLYELEKRSDWSLIPEVAAGGDVAAIRKCAKVAAAAIHSGRLGIEQFESLREWLIHCLGQLGHDKSPDQAFNWIVTGRRHRPANFYTLQRKIMIARAVEKRLVANPRKPLKVHFAAVSLDFVGIAATTVETYYKDWKRGER